MSEPTTKTAVRVDVPIESEKDVTQNSETSTVTSGARSNRTEVARLQLMRLQEYLTDCLALPSAEEAMLGTTTGCLMKVAFRLSDSIDAVLEEGLENRSTNESLIWSITALTRVSRLVERLTHLRVHLSNARNAVKQLTIEQE
jgi:hypothetical protein